MTKNLIPKNVPTIGNISPVWKDGEIVGLTCVAEVNYGEMGLQHPCDVWGDLTPDEQKSAEALVAKIRSLVEAEFLGGE